MSSHRHHKSSSQSTYDTSSQKAIRNVFSFFLFIAIALLSLAICTNTAFVNPSKFASIFTDATYVSAFYDDVKQYSYDVCDLSNLPHEVVDSSITYEAVEKIAVSYAEGVMDVSDQYSSTSYDGYLGDLNESLTKDLNNYVKQNGINLGKEQKSTINEFVITITDYIRQQVEFEYMDKLQTASNIGKTVATILEIVFAIASAVLVLIVVSIGNKRYRGVRAVAYSLLASALLQLSFVAEFGIIKRFKTLVIYPTYLCDSVMKYINNCVLNVAVSSFVSLSLAIVVMTIVWKLKREQK